MLCYMQTKHLMTLENTVCHPLSVLSWEEFCNTPQHASTIHFPPYIFLPSLYPYLTKTKFTKALQEAHRCLTTLTAALSLSTFTLLHLQDTNVPLNSDKKNCMYNCHITCLVLPVDNCTLGKKVEYFIDQTDSSNPFMSGMVAMQISMKLTITQQTT